MLGGLAALLLANEARANQYGELRIRSNTTLTDDRYGDIVFDADNVTLDCAKHQVHISSFTKLNGGQKVAIYANGRSGITIKNCKIVGGFDLGMMIQESSHVTVQGIVASTSLFFFENSNTVASGLTLNAPIALFVDRETSGSFSANVPTCTTFGVSVDETNFTTISNTTISGCEFEGISGSNNHNLTFDGVNVSNCRYGLETTGDDHLNVIDSTFSNNEINGLNIFSNTSSSFSDNVASGNGNCDANEVTSTLDSWSGNTFGTVCGSVPAVH